MSSDDKTTSRAAPIWALEVSITTQSYATRARESSTFLGRPPSKNVCSVARPYCLKSNHDGTDWSRRITAGLDPSGSDGSLLDGCKSPK